MLPTVLLVDDDPTVLMFLEAGMQDRGYSVLSARSGGEALSILDSGLAPIDILVVDIRIGAGVNGWEIARCARDITSTLPIVYITGDSALSFAFEGLANSVLLQKPFSDGELADAVGLLLRKVASKLQPA
jgi:DNA-binding response OmpR family regulator